MDYLDSVAKTLEETKPRSARQVAQAFGMATESRYPKSEQALKESDRLALFQSVMVIKGMEEAARRDEALGVTYPRIDRFERDLDIFTHVAEERGVSVDQVEASYYEFRS
jgi:hypothetical protein